MPHQPLGLLSPEFGPDLALSKSKQRLRTPTQWCPASDKNNQPWKEGGLALRERVATVSAEYSLSTYGGRLYLSNTLNGRKAETDMEQRNEVTLGDAII